QGPSRQERRAAHRRRQSVERRAADGTAESGRPRHERKGPRLLSAAHGRAAGYGRTLWCNAIGSGELGEGGSGQAARHGGRLSRQYRCLSDPCLLCAGASQAAQAQAAVREAFEDDDRADGLVSRSEGGSRRARGSGHWRWSTQPEMTKSATASRTYAAYVLGLLTLVNLLNYLDRNVVYAVFEPIKRDLHLSDAQLGWLGSAYIVVLSLAALPLGVIG